MMELAKQFFSHPMKQSLYFNAATLQETGSLHRFVNVISARTAIGHNSQGDVLLVQVDGKTDQKGKKKIGCRRSGKILNVI